MNFRRYRYDPVASGFVVLIVAFALTYGTHVVWSLRLLTADAAAPIGKYVLAGIGAFLPPIGAAHGVMIWFGAGG